MNKVILLICLLLTVNFHIVHCKNYAYNRCEYRKSLSSYSGHAACLGTALNYNLIRTIECHDENYHVCCKDPLRQDIQQSRQVVFRQIAELGQVLSENCTRLVLCEQSCKDRVNSLFERADYPYIMADDNQSQRDYVLAYNRGEKLGLCDSPVVQSYHIKSDQYCDQQCYANYGADCQSDLDHSLSVRLYHKWARVFHESGMIAFGAYWAAKTNVEFILYKFHNLKRNGTDMSISRRKRYYIDSEWRRFLQAKNTTSLDMIDFFANMTSSQFNNFTSTFNLTLLDINTTEPGLNETWLNVFEDIIH